MVRVLSTRWRPSGRALCVATLSLGLLAALPAIALADAANPRSVTVEKDGLTVTLSGTWTWPSRTMPCGPGTSSNRAVGWAADWGDGFTGNFVHSKDSPSNVGFHMGTASDKAVKVSSANNGLGDCGTGSSGPATGTFQGLTHTYATSGTYDACVVFYDVHYAWDHGKLVVRDSKQLVAGGRDHNTDNSAETIALNDADDEQCIPVRITVVEPKTELTLRKTAEQASYDSLEDVIDYRFRVTNTGNQPIDGPVTIDDPKADDLDCPAVTTVGNLDAILDPDEAVVCTGTHPVTQANLDNGSFTNTATASADGVTSNEDSVTVDAIQDHDATLRKTVDERTYNEVGDVLHYSFVVTNSGNVSLEGPVAIDDPKAEGLDCPAVSTVGDQDGALDPGESVTCTGTHEIGQGALDKGSFTNTATATVDGITSNEDSATSDAVQDRQLKVVKTADEASFDAVGDVLRFTITVSNPGNITLVGPLTIEDAKLADLACEALADIGDLDSDLDPGESVVCTGTHEVTQANLDKGGYTNTATASIDGESDEDSVTVDAVQRPKLTLAKTVAEASYDHVGQVLHYTFEVTNTGNITLDGPVTIADDRTANESCPAVSTVGDQDGALDPGESITCTATKTIVKANLTNGSLKNTATASAGGVTSKPDSVTIRADLDIYVLLDASGSISSVTARTIREYNAFLHTWQAKAPGQLYSLTLFNSYIYRNRYVERNIDTVPDLTSSTFTARGNTPLYDSLVKAINAFAASDPEGQVIFVVTTDGVDTASTQYTKAQAKALVAAKAAEGWIFIWTNNTLG